MQTYIVVAAIPGSFVIALGVVLLLIAVGSVVKGLWVDWREFSARYDAVHAPQRIDVSNVAVIYPNQGGAA